MGYTPIRCGGLGVGLTSQSLFVNGRIGRAGVTGISKGIRITLCLTRVSHIGAVIGRIGYAVIIGVIGIAALGLITDISDPVSIRIGLVWIRGKRAIIDKIRDPILIKISRHYKGVSAQFGLFHICKGIVIVIVITGRSEERRVGKEGRSRGAP